MKGVSKENALEAVSGYICANDVSAQDNKFADGQWTRGKSPDTFCPVGPELVPAAEVRTRNLRIRAIVSGEVLQDSTTANLIFGIDDVIAYASQDDDAAARRPHPHRRLPAWACSRNPKRQSRTATRSRSRSKGWAS